jgi:glycosyltransferase involved in cell wall biosynthesis
MSRSVGVILPAYRPDVDRLAGYVGAIRDAVAPDEIRVELDAATPAVRDRIAALPVTVNEASARRGKGAAITAGFEALSTDVLAFADADGSTPASSLADVIRSVADDEADLAAGSRRHPDATVRSHQTVARRHLGDAFAWIARRLLTVSLHDYQCGAKALSRDAWGRVRPHLHEPGFAWDIELLAVADAVGCRISEIPVVWEDQPNSTVSPVRTSLRLARGLVVARHRGRLLGNDPLHTLIDRGRASRPALVDRFAGDRPEAADE